MDNQHDIFTLPPLYGKSSAGKTKVWNISVLPSRHDEEPVKIVTTHGYIDGKMTSETVNVYEGKNIGKKNETSPYEQAVAEAHAKFQKKLDDNYTENRLEDEIPANLLPMLAHPYEKRKHDIVWPAFVQPKLDGCRCLAHKISDTEIEYNTRGGKKFTTLDHLTSDLLKIMEVGEILDGEIYFHEELTFQEIVSAVKKKNANTSLLQYHIYDTVNTQKSFSERRADLIIKFSNLLLSSPLQRVETIHVEDEEAMLDLNHHFVLNGYEGTMIRNANGKYIMDHRSKDLLKFKQFVDEEFIIIGGEGGKGREENCVVFKCECPGGVFDVRPKGTMEQRTEWLKNIESIIGKQLTVRYQRLSDDGIPIPPVGIAIRDYE